jgi:multicomponent Na+:H+ antiporter subunit D
MTEQAPVLIIVVPLMSALLNLVVGLRWKRLCYPLVVAALGACVLSSIAILDTVIKHGNIHYWLGGWSPPGGIEYMIDHLNAYMAVIVSSVGLIVAVYSKKSVEKELPGRAVTFYTIFLLLVTGLLGIVVTGDVFNLYVFLEISSLSGYALIAVGEDRAPLSSYNYVIMGTIGACFYLLGVGYLYIVTGTLNMADLASLLPSLYDSKVVLVAFAFFMVGVSIKIAFFPLHAWLPDAYTYAPSSVSAFVASTMTKVGAYVMIRIMYTLFQPYFSIEVLPATTILGWVAAAAMLYGCVMALAQTDLKRMLSYIIVAEVGYIVMGVSLENRMGFTGAVLHILNDALMMACLFMAVGAIMYKTGSRDIRGLGRLNRKMPLTIAAFAIAGLSIVGIPPTCGFFSKWYLVLGAIDARKWVFAGTLLLSSLMSAVIFFRIIETVYLRPVAASHDGGTPEAPERDEAPLSMLVPMYLTVAGILALGLLSGRIISAVIRYTVPKGF